MSGESIAAVVNKPNMPNDRCWMPKKFLESIIAIYQLLHDTRQKTFREPILGTHYEKDPRRCKRPPLRTTSNPAAVPGGGHESCCAVASNLPMQLRLSPRWVAALPPNCSYRLPFVGATLPQFLPRFFSRAQSSFSAINPFKFSRSI